MSDSETERVENWVMCNADGVKENGLTALVWYEDHQRGRTPSLLARSNLPC